MINRALIIGKFMPFHKGHEYLIEFTHYFDKFDKIDVIVGSMDSEPINGYDRFKAVREFAYSISDEITVHHLHKDIPQYPEDHSDFWKIWSHEIFNKIHCANDYKLTVFSSEKYGKELSEQLFKHKEDKFLLETNFIPVDIDRNIYSISGTTLRNDKSQFQLVNETMKRFIAQHYIFIGPESAGKTTLAKACAKKISGTFVPEYARTYLDEKGADLSNEKFHEILRGQTAQESYIYTSPPNYYNFHDTSVVTTYGWWQIYNSEHEFPYKNMLWTYNWLSAKNVKFILVHDNIPYVKDHIRYNETERDSNVEYWKDVLENVFKITNYAEIKSSSLEDRIKEMKRIVFGDKYKITFVYTSPYGSYNAECKVVRQLSDDLYLIEYIDPITEKITQREIDGVKINIDHALF